MSSIMGEVIFHSTLEEYENKIKPRINKPKPNVESDTGNSNDDWVITSTTQTTKTTNPDSDLPTSDYGVRDVDGGDYGNYDIPYGAYGDELPKEVDGPDVIVEENDEVGNGDLPNDSQDVESLDADLPTLDYGDLGDIYGDYGSSIYGSYRKRRSTADSRASKREKCLRDYWEEGDERCICSMIPVDFYFDAEFMECRLDQHSVQRCNFQPRDSTIC